MEVAYQGDIPHHGTVAEATAWLRSHRQPLVDGSEMQLGQGATPAVALPRLGPHLYLKDESANPTWSHKDRANATNAAVARLIGAKGMISSSTGNHGASVAAFGAAAGLPTAILCRPGFPDAVTQMIWSYGGVPFRLEGGPETEIVSRFVADGWYPATSMERGPGGQSTPFGAEAYKRLAWELLEQLDQVPAFVFVPTAGGDTYYGVSKGLAEICYSCGITRPCVVAVQPVTANPLQRSLSLGRTATVAGAHSVALSIANERTGLQAVAAVKRWGGEVVTVTDGDILLAWEDLAHCGHLLEPASAAALAGYRSACKTGLLATSESAVILGTASGTKWLSAVGDRLPVEPVASENVLIETFMARGALTPTISAPPDRRDRRDQQDAASPRPSEWPTAPGAAEQR
jgi:threonine synthase